MNSAISTWTKDKISPLFNEIKPIKNDGLDTSPGNLWSLKKEIALHLYIPSYFNIIKNHFKKWFYYDPFCGSGLIKFTKPSLLKGVKFPGSPIVALSQRTKYPFHSYFLSDKAKPATTILKTRLQKLYSLQIEVKNMKFPESIVSVEKIDARVGHESCLAVIDPVGYKPIPWESMKRLFKIKTCDLFIIVMTSDLNRNLSIARKPGNSNDMSLTKFLGNDSWKKCNTGDDIAKLYSEQISCFGKYTEILSVNRVGETKIYDIILSTRSEGGIRAMRGITEKLKQVTTEDIRSQAIPSSGVIRPLDEY